MKKELIIFGHFSFCIIFMLFIWEYPDILRSQIGFLKYLLFYPILIIGFSRAIFIVFRFKLSMSNSYLSLLLVTPMIILGVYFIVRMAMFIVLILIERGLFL